MEWCKGYTDQSTFVREDDQVHTRIDILCIARCLGISAEGIDLRSCVRFRVYCLPNGKESIDLSLRKVMDLDLDTKCEHLRMVKPEDWIEARIRDTTHMTSITN